MTSYKELALQYSRLFNAVAGGYIPAYNFNNMEQMQAIIRPASRQEPVILQVSSGARKYANSNLLRNMARRRVRGRARLQDPIVLHLDHGDSYDYASTVSSGFSSVMIDGRTAYDENVALTRKVCE